MKNPIVVGFPLRGEWYAPNTPGSQIPSHGTNRLGSRYAYDFVQVDWNRKGYPAIRQVFWNTFCGAFHWPDIIAGDRKYMLPATALSLKPGTAIRNDRGPICLEIWRMPIKMPAILTRTRMTCKRWRAISLSSSAQKGVYAALVHLQTGSVQVAAGQSATKGERIGRVGHSGNSFAPHLHFQLMDRCDLASARGLPCAFERYEVFRDGNWVTVRDGVPTNRDRIRFLSSNSPGDR